MKKVGIVAFAFGVPHDIEPNKIIAEITSEKARESRASVYTQSDIKVDPDIRVEYIGEDESKPPSTLRMAKDAVAWAQERGISTLYVAAAEPHLWRCIRDLTYAITEGKVQIQVEICEKIKQYPEKVWYCKNSLQVRTQSKTKWRVREFILELMPMSLYAKIAF